MGKHKETRLTERELIELKKYAYSTSRCLTPSIQNDGTTGEWIDNKAQQIYTG